jgi:hypothetical protein
VRHSDLRNASAVVTRIFYSRRSDLPYRKSCNESRAPPPNDRPLLLSADNALAFDDAATAQDFLRTNRILRARPVYRLAPYLIPLLHAHERQHTVSIWESWTESRISRWYFERAQEFERN